MTRTQQFFTTLFASFLLLGAFAFSIPAQAVFDAGDPTAALDQAADITTIGGGGQDQIFNTIGNVVNVLLGLLGIIFFLITLYAGFIWMTAQGDPAKVTKATTMLTQGVIGMIIILSAFAISNFAISQLLLASQV
ncbi:hypothetical protein COV06_03290 [Candidatus Uhrbacteria bacterium CG10_big_fil_rev_8_21_14_0_10_50_16]|uniref:Uncharacterized protein n=1 Tax=Candidatus Uhrbacteria bacterium CG10_big_fil_rev_8_21_14_0_10_50_16 TaxID=1975039 RepID=A0A2H0RLZ4_9BACT|nr:MAG: hypothetical protein COV06_03290 [Candidatus Uhrbacteria bacterium CG10_big_fil_rev_8_21_14_0_10_50_16]